MKHITAALLLSIALLLGTVLTGCGSKAASEAPEASSSSESEEKETTAESSETVKAVSSETGVPEPEDSSSAEEPVPTMTPTEDNEFDPGFNPQTIIDENYDPTVVEDPVIPPSPDGEGTVSFQGEKVSVAQDAEAAEAGREYPVTDAAGASSYTLRIDSMELTDMRSDFEEDASNVVLVRYTVTSVASSDPVFAGASGFRLVDGNNIACRSYELDPEAEPLSQISPLSKGESGSFCIAFAVEGAPSSLTLVFGDPAGTGARQYTLKASSSLIAGLK
ncbi:MAG: hypothetical protein IJJ50_01545 [Lachnospiraceae bacterium]|nr:hypothetical protein [Lachnospiraceae bacterium]